MRILKFNIGDVVRILKYQNIFAKGVYPNWSEEVFVIKVVNREKVFGTFYEKESRKNSRRIQN